MSIPVSVEFKHLQYRTVQPWLEKGQKYCNFDKYCVVPPVPDSVPFNQRRIYSKYYNKCA